MWTACLRTMTGCLSTALLIGGGVAEAQNALLTVEPADGLFDGPALLGTSAAITDKIAVVGGPNIDPPAGIGPPETFLYHGAVNVYTTDGAAWTLETILHPEDDDPVDQFFGVGVALRGRQLIVASTGALWVYERHEQGWEETDKLNLPADESIPKFPTFTFGQTQLYFENGVLAFKVLEQGVGGVIVIYKVDRKGQLHRVARLTAPNDSQHLGFTGDLSLNEAGDLLAAGVPASTSIVSLGTGSVYLYASRGNHWYLKDSLAAPGPQALGFGTGVALRGKRLIVGAPEEGTTPVSVMGTTAPAGAAYVYRHKGDRWVQTQVIEETDLLPVTPGLSLFGSAIATNGRFVVVNAPQDAESCASCRPGSFSSLVQWENGQLVNIPSQNEFAITAGGGLSMSRRYVIVGDEDQIFGNHAVILDLTTVAPLPAAEDEQPED